MKTATDNPQSSVPEGAGLQDVGPETLTPGREPRFLAFPEPSAINASSAAATLVAGEIHSANIRFTVIDKIDSVTTGTSG